MDAVRATAASHSDSQLSAKIEVCLAYPLGKPFPLPLLELRLLRRNRRSTLGPDF
jgi:hypothetical protein